MKDIQGELLTNNPTGCIVLDCSFDIKALTQTEITDDILFGVDP